MGDLEKHLVQFIRRFLEERPPLLLGLSGGCDSLALFYLLLENRYPFEAVYVDHGWRKESVEEGGKLAALCSAESIPFYLRRLNCNSEGRNLEEEGRKGRLAIFKEIVIKRQLKGVLLAHHADDHAETVLKRIFEGASLPKLRGMAMKHTLDGLEIYRPLLKVRKTELQQFLESKGKTGLVDPTNFDPQFLRARIRTALLPDLSRLFGKQISQNLCRLGEMAQELEEYLTDQSAPYLERMERDQLKLSLDLKEASIPLFLMKHVLRCFFSSVGIALSHRLLEQIVHHLQRASCHKMIKVARYMVVLHKGKISVDLSQACLK